MTTVAALFVRKRSIYHGMPDVDAWSIERDAMNWPGGCPVVAHPPCARWSMINGVVLSRYSSQSERFAWGNDGGTFAFALAAVRRWGGVLEHPGGTRAFAHYGLPRKFRPPDEFGGWTIEVNQLDFGHRAVKRTWLYLVRVDPAKVDLPPRPNVRARGAATVSRVMGSRTCELVSRAERESTPPEFAQWLVALARTASVDSRARHAA